MELAGRPGELQYRFPVKECWRKIKGRGLLLGYVTRDMQIIVEDCNNQRQNCGMLRIYA